MIKDWNILEQECKQCRKCGLCQERTHVVFGVGVQNAEVMFIGEGPGTVSYTHLDVYKRQATIPVISRATITLSTGWDASPTRRPTLSKSIAVENGAISSIQW